ncbi:DNA oxidative demethylase ALKBH2 isoform X3 [Quercus suber]|uniref:DNA oxidative demethylase ALKBH2 isoform X3 n=1 Tax=Quercus suber TaxID=58331 RepID=UPI0032DE57C7
MSLKLKAVSDSDTDPKNPNNENIIKREIVDLRNGSEVLYIQRFFTYDQSWKWFHFLNNHIPWTRPTVRVFGRSCLQVHKALPGSCFNSLLLNRYKGGNDYVGWHSDDEKLYGLTPEIASVSFGCDRDFFLKKKPCKTSNVSKRHDEEPASKRLKKSCHADQYTFKLKHGSLLVMRGNTQRDWIHSVPKRAKVDTTRINLTFRHVL